MRHKQLLLLFVLIGGISFGQTTNNEIDHNKQVIELSDSIKRQAILIRTLSEQISLKNVILEERLKQASDTISNQNALSDGFGVIYTIITIIVALLGIVLPILTYQFGIKPSQKALKEFENNIDKKFEQYLIDSRNSQIEQATENLKSQNQELKSNAVTFLSLTQHQGFNDQQLFKLFLLLKSSNIDQTTKGTIAYSISNRKSDFATEYFYEALKDSSNVGVKYAALRYFANIGIENHLKIYRDLISQANDKLLEFSTILIHNGSINKNANIILINDKEFIDGLGVTATNSLRNDFEIYSKSWQINEEDISNSYLKKVMTKTEASS
ncbi:MAG TPA: hypothetical protein VK483_00245 [Chitinophagaceae bacterium]|nr:hypothetical protein [Chitinophagaceae bacterium]